MIFILTFENVKWGTKNYFKVKKLYLSAFPKKERFPIIGLLAMGLQKRVNFQAIYDQKNFIGLIFWTYAKQIIYIGYLAVDPIWRCQGYGSEILKLMKRNHPGQEIVLDIEPVIKTAKNYSQRINRLLFYKHNGFKLTQDNLVDAGGRYSILSSDKHFKKRSLSQLLDHMSFNCYKYKIVKR